MRLDQHSGKTKGYLSLMKLIKRYLKGKRDVRLLGIIKFHILDYIICQRVLLQRGQLMSLVPVMRYRLWKILNLLRGTRFMHDVLLKPTLIGNM